MFKDHVTFSGMCRKWFGWSFPLHQYNIEKARFDWLSFSRVLQSEPSLQNLSLSFATAICEICFEGRGGCTQAIFIDLFLSSAISAGSWPQFCVRWVDVACLMSRFSNNLVLCWGIKGCSRTCYHLGWCLTQLNIGRLRPGPRSNPLPFYMPF